MIALFLAAALAQSGCAAPEGTTALLDRPSRFVVGEMHGTVETPEAFARLVCEAAARGPLVVAVELPERIQPALDAFLAADDEAAALQALRPTPLLDGSIADGRSSRAMLDMMGAVRRLKREGRDIAFHAFQPSSTGGGRLPQAYYELSMGASLARAAIDRPDARVLALVGNIHAAKTAHPRIGLPAAAHLPSEDVLSLYVVQQGGEAWNCMAVCGANPLPAHYDADARGIILEEQDGFDGLMALGPSTASPPLAGGE